MAGTTCCILDDLPKAAAPEEPTRRLLVEQQRFGYTAEDLKLILGPMAQKGIEPTGSMGDDIPLAILSKRPGCSTTISANCSPR
jgi:glutamate synthase (NADPH/NADH) large chain